MSPVARKLLGAAPEADSRCSWKPAPGESAAFTDADFTAAGAEIGSDSKTTDIAVIVGANDMVNPEAIKNPLFERENTQMCFGDGKAFVQEVVTELTES